MLMLKRGKSRRSAGRRNRNRRLPASGQGRGLRSSSHLILAPTREGRALDLLRTIPEERVWLESQQSPQTRRAYRSDVVHFMETMGVTETAEFRKVDRMAVIAWKRKMDQDGAKPRTARRRLSSLSSLFSHLVNRHVVDTNPLREIRRPRVNRKQGTTPAFSPPQARKLLDAPAVDTLQGLRDGDSHLRGRTSTTSWNRYVSPSGGGCRPSLARIFGGETRSVSRRRLAHHIGIIERLDATVASAAPAVCGWCGGSPSVLPRPAHERYLAHRRCRRQENVSHTPEINC